MKRPILVLGVLLYACAAASADGLKWVKCQQSEFGEAGWAQQAATWSADDAKKQATGLVHERAKLATVKVGQLDIAVAIDADKADAADTDAIRFNFAGKPDFDKSRSYPLRISKSKANDNGKEFEQVVGQFGPIDVKIKVGDDEVPAILSGYYFRGASRRSLALRLLTARQGDCALGDKKHAVRLIDTTSNLRHDDKTQPRKALGGPLTFEAGDAVIVDCGKGDFKGALAKGHYGQPILVDGKWWQITLDAKAGKLAAEESKDPTGTMWVKVDMPRWTMRLEGKKHKLIVSGGKEPVTVPADSYRIEGYTLDQTAPGIVGGKASLTAGSWQPAIRIEIEKGKQAEPKLGPPLTAKLTATPAGRDVRISMSFTDQAGMQIGSVVGEKGAVPDAPRFTVVDESGKEVHKGTLEYG